MPFPLFLFFSTAIAVFGVVFVSKRLVSPAYLSRHIPLVALFSMLAKLAKADGVVTKEEIQIIDDFINNELKLEQEVRSLMIKVFNLAKMADEPFEIYARNFYAHFRDKPLILMSTIELFLRVVHANGRKINRNEERMILAAVHIFQLDYDLYHRMKEPYFPEIKKYYGKLNCQPADSVDKIKDSYRRLAMKYHPDKLQVQDLPIALRELANDKFREIQEAYKVVRKDRGF